MPIRLRVTLAFTIVMAILLTALGFFVYSRFETELSEQIDQSLRTHGDDIASLVAHRDLSRSVRLLGREESFAQVLTPDGRIYATTPLLGSNAQLTPAEAARASRESFLLTRPHVPQHPGRGEAAGSAGDRPRADLRRRGGRHSRRPQRVARGTCGPSS